MGLFDNNQLQGVLFAHIDNGFKNNFFLIAQRQYFLETKEVMLFPDIGIVLCYILIGRDPSSRVALYDNCLCLLVASVWFETTCIECVARLVINNSVFPNTFWLWSAV